MNVIQEGYSGAMVQSYLAKLGQNDSEEVIHVKLLINGLKKDRSCFQRKEEGFYG